MIFRNKLFWQMFLTASFVAVSTAAVIYITVQVQMETQLKEKARVSLASQLHFAKLLGRSYFKSGRWDASQEWFESFSQSNTRLSLIDVDGKVLFDSKHAVASLDNHKNRPELLEAASLGRGEAVRFSTSLNTELIYLASKIMVDGQTVGYVRLASAVKLINADLNKMENQLLVVISVTLIFLFSISYFLSKRFYRPIGVAARFAQQVSVGEYQQRLPGLGSDEISLLERSLNELSRKTEERLARVVASRNQVSGILSGLNEGVVALSQNQKIAHINRTALKILGIKHDSIGLDVWQVVRKVEITEIIDSAFGGRAHSKQRIEIEGRSFDLEAIALENNLAEMDGLILVFQDVTERVLIDKIRTDFVVNASHELKTPLAVVKGLSETILDDETMPVSTSRDFVSRILVQTDRLAKIVQDLMHLSKFESYKTQTLKLENFDFTLACREVMRATQQLAYTSEVELTLECEITELIMPGDQDALMQLMTNLIENAVKYSAPNGHVLVRLTEDIQHIIFIVEDDGIGISSIDQSRIFERFYRVDPARSRALGGTGLGLSIVKYIAQAHHGIVEVESVPNEGSKFIVRIPKASLGE